ncbi:MAG: hypothetical protein IJV18_01025, partial [Acidaminococcaceae bacterium]|nr:hypothetical protein [Acidaminococcaceae bacterium]
MKLRNPLLCFAYAFPIAVYNCFFYKTAVTNGLSTKMTTLPGCVFPTVLFNLEEYVNGFVRFFVQGST